MGVSCVIVLSEMPCYWVSCHHIAMKCITNRLLQKPHLYFCPMQEAGVFAKEQNLEVSASPIILMCAMRI